MGILGGGNSNILGIFTPKLGEDEPILTNMFKFQMGWFNHQPGMGVFKNRGTPKSSILIGISIINHPFWGTTIFGNARICQPGSSFNG